MNAPINISSKEHQFAWYTIVPSTQPFEQGDLLNTFPIIIPPPLTSEITKAPENQPSEVIDAPAQAFDVVLMTQSCDIRDFSDEAHVILCPRYSLTDAKLPSGKSLDNSDGWGKLIRGNYTNVHLINKCEIENYTFDYQVVDLQRILSVPLYLVKAVAAQQKNRVRLLPPYREHLAQAFARQFMRVGLPIDLPREYPNASKKK